MSDVAIKVEGLSKLYRIGTKQVRYKTLRDTLTNMLTAPFHRFRSAGQDEPDKRDKPDRRDRRDRLCQ